MRIDCPPHYHIIELPNGRRIRTKADCYKSPNFRYDKELGFIPESVEYDEELGIFGALASIAAPLVSNLIGGGGDKGGTSQTPPVDVSSLMGAIREGVTKSDLKNIVRELLSTVPPPVRQQVQDALREYQAGQASIQETLKAVSRDINKQFQPQMQAVIQALKLKQEQTQATNEHNIIVKNDKRWKANSENQLKILQRIDALERRLGRDTKKAAIWNKKVAASFGIP